MLSSPKVEAMPYVALFRFSRLFPKLVGAMPCARALLIWGAPALDDRRTVRQISQRLAFLLWPLMPMYKVCGRCVP